MEPVKLKVSASTFQQCNGENYSHAGIELSSKGKHGTLSAYVGLATGFSKESTTSIFDGKGSLNYGNTPLSGGIRLRSANHSLRARIQPATITIPFGENTSAYLTPYVEGKINIDDKSKALNYGVFGGVNQKIGPVSVFIEGQLYDVTKVDASTASVNLGVSIPIKTY